LAQNAYNYGDDELSAIYRDFSIFCLTNLKKFKKEQGLPTIAFFYHQENTVDGAAGNSFGMPFIYLNRGIVDIVFPFFSDKENVFNATQFAGLKALGNLLHKPIGHLMFEATTLFAFYHERAHIRQFKSEILKENAQQYVFHHFQVFEFVLQKWAIR